MREVRGRKGGAGREVRAAIWVLGVNRAQQLPTIPTIDRDGINMDTRKTVAHARVRGIAAQ